MGSVRRVAGGIAVAASFGMPLQAVLAHGPGSPTPTLPSLLAAWSPDPLPWTGSILAAVAYVAAARRVNRAHPRVPIQRWRVAAWLAGVGTVLAALVSPIDVFADDLLSVHMIQHLLLAMVAPPLLALGAPVTLLLRVASPRIRQRVVLRGLHARPVQLLASPLPAWLLFTGAMVVTHFTPLYEAALENPSVHVAEHVAYLVTGLLFWWPVVASDPVPRRMSHLQRVAYVALQMPVNAAIGLAIYFAPTILYPHYATIARTWGPDPSIDQQLGGLLMWGVGDVLLLAVIPVLVHDWMRAQDRLTARLDGRLLAARNAVSSDPAGGSSAGG